MGINMLKNLTKAGKIYKSETNTNLKRTSMR